MSNRSHECIYLWRSIEEAFATLTSQVAAQKRKVGDDALLILKQATGQLSRKSTPKMKVSTFSSRDRVSGTTRRKSGHIVEKPLALDLMSSAAKICEKNGAQSEDGGADSRTSFSTEATPCTGTAVASHASRAAKRNANQSDQAVDQSPHVRKCAKRNVLPLEGGLKSSPDSGLARERAVEWDEVGVLGHPSREKEEEMTTHLAMCEPVLDTAVEDSAPDSRQHASGSRSHRDSDDVSPACACSVLNSARDLNSGSEEEEETLLMPCHSSSPSCSAAVVVPTAAGGQDLVAYAAATAATASERDLYDQAAVKAKLRRAAAVKRCMHGTVLERAPGVIQLPSAEIVAQMFKDTRAPAVAVESAHAGEHVEITRNYVPVNDEGEEGALFHFHAHHSSFASFAVDQGHDAAMLELSASVSAVTAVVSTDTSTVRLPASILPAPPISEEASGHLAEAPAKTEPEARPRINRPIRRYTEQENTRIREAYRSARASRQPLAHAARDLSQELGRTCIAIADRFTLCKHEDDLYATPGAVQSSENPPQNTCELAAGATALAAASTNPLYLPSTRSGVGPEIDTPSASAGELAPRCLQPYSAEELALVWQAQAEVRAGRATRKEAVRRVSEQTGRSARSVGKRLSLLLSSADQG